MSHVAIHRLPRTKYPFTMQAFRLADDVEVWALTIEAPVSGLAGFEVPPLGRRYGPVRLRVEFGDGTVEEVGPA